MSLRVILESGKKGSNPGGKCWVENGIGNQSFNAYFKYCYGPPVVPESHFRGPHQPIYESVTFELARIFGLKTPLTYLLLNNKKNVVFERWKENREHDPSGREFYFVSKFLGCDLGNDDMINGFASNLIDKEKVYLEALLISDIIGRRQNYLVCQAGGQANNQVRILYIDLGCSFVHAKEGRLSIPNKMKPKFERKKKDLKRFLKDLSKYELIKADNMETFNLKELEDRIRGLTLPTLNPYGRIRLSSVITDGEMEAIEEDIISGVHRNLKNFKERGLLIG